MFFYIYSNFLIFFNSRDIWACIYQASPEAKDSITAGTKKKPNPFWVITENAKRLASIYFCSEILDEHQPLTSERLCLICVLDVRWALVKLCYRFICAEKGTGGWRAPWPPERVVISPAITWLHPTPSRQKSKPFYFISFCSVSCFCLSSSAWKN